MESTRRPGGLTKFRPTDREECGLLIENDEHQIYIVRVPNRADRDCDFTILKEDVDRVREVLSPDEAIVGFFHTHLPDHDCEPTDADLSGAELNPEMEHLIYKPDTEEICWYGAALIEVSDKT